MDTNFNTTWFWKVCCPHALQCVLSLWCRGSSRLFQALPFSPLAVRWISSSSVVHLCKGHADLVFEVYMSSAQLRNGTTGLSLWNRHSSCANGPQEKFLIYNGCGGCNVQGSHTFENLKGATVAHLYFFSRKCAMKSPGVRSCFFRTQAWNRQFGCLDCSRPHALVRGYWKPHSHLGRTSAPNVQCKFGPKRRCVDAGLAVLPSLQAHRPRGPGDPVLPPPLRQCPGGERPERKCFQQLLLDGAEACGRSDHRRQNSVTSLADLNPNGFDLACRRTGNVGLLVCSYMHTLYLDLWSNCCQSRMEGLTSDSGEWIRLAFKVRLEYTHFFGLTIDCVPQLPENVKPKNTWWFVWCFFCTDLPIFYCIKVCRQPKDMAAINPGRRVCPPSPIRPIWVWFPWRVDY